MLFLKSSLLAVCLARVPNLLASPVINGYADTSHSYKYHVSIRHTHNPSEPNSGELLCGGTIIDDRHVLSAAHCFLRLNGKHFQAALYPITDGVVVVSGTSQTYGGGTITPVDKILIPREYNDAFYADVSVLKLRNYLNVNHFKNELQILPMDKGRHDLDVFDYQKAFIPGNGYNTLVDGHVVERTADTRQVLEVHMIPRHLCKHYNYLICAVNIDDKTIRTLSKGDSGSPLVYANRVIGVVSIGPHNVNIKSQIKSTRISKFIDFIEKAKNGDIHPSTMFILEKLINH